MLAARRQRNLKSVRGRETAIVKNHNNSAASRKRGKNEDEHHTKRVREDKKNEIK
jgi:hypothetical protein